MRQRLTPCGNTPVCTPPLPLLLFFRPTARTCTPMHHNTAHTPSRCHGSERLDRSGTVPRVAGRLGQTSEKKHIQHFRHLSKLTSPRTPTPAPTLDALDSDAVPEEMVTRTSRAESNTAVIVNGTFFARSSHHAVSRKFVCSSAGVYDKDYRSLPL